MRYDAGDYLLELVTLKEFRMAHSAARLEIEPGRPLPAHARYGWNHLPAGACRTKADVDLAGTARNKIGGALPPRMKPIAEVLCLLPPDRLAGFCQRIEISGRPLLDATQVNRLRTVAQRRLQGTAGDTDRKTLRRLLKRIDPVVCRLPADELDERLEVGDPVSVSASQIHLTGQVVCVPSAPGWPVVGVLERGGVQATGIPSPRELTDRHFAWSPSLDGS